VRYCTDRADATADTVIRRHPGARSSLKPSESTNANPLDHFGNRSSPAERLAAIMPRQRLREDAMRVRAACLIVFATCAGFIVASALRGNARGEKKRAHKAQIHEWENEGGSLAEAASPAPVAAAASA